MKKYGFTLAEILITLGIIGVVAALTMPMLASGSRNQISASRLAETVTNLDNAFTSMIATEGVDDLTETEAYANKDNVTDLYGSLGDYLKLNGYSTTDSSEYTYPNTIKYLGGGSTTSPFPHIGNTFKIILETKSGPWIFISDKCEYRLNPDDYDCDALKRIGCSLCPVVFYIVIDTNGPDSPNMLGRDIFYFAVGGNGHLYPYGGPDVQKAIGTSYTQDSNADDYEADDTYFCSDGAGEGCAYRLITDGYKMTY